MKTQMDFWGQIPSEGLRLEMEVVQQKDGRFLTPKERHEAGEEEGHCWRRQRVAQWDPKGTVGKMEDEERRGRGRENFGEKQGRDEFRQMELFEDSQFVPQKEKNQECCWVSAVRQKQQQVV